MNVFTAVFNPSKEEAAQIRSAMLKMRQRNELTNDHIAVFNFYLNRGTPPNPERLKEAAAHNVWHDLMSRLNTQLGGSWFDEFAGTGNTAQVG